MSLKIMIAGCAKDERPQVESSIKDAFGARAESDPWNVSLVNIANQWSIEIDGPEPHYKGLSFVAAAEDLAASVRRALNAATPEAGSAGRSGAGAVADAPPPDPFHAPTPSAPGPAPTPAPPQVEAAPIQAAPPVSAPAIPAPAPDTLPPELMPELDPAMLDSSPDALLELTPSEPSAPVAPPSLEATSPALDVAVPAAAPAATPVPAPMPVPSQKAAAVAEADGDRLDRHRCEGCAAAFDVSYYAVAGERVEMCPVACPSCWHVNSVPIAAGAGLNGDYQAQAAS